MHINSNLQSSYQCLHLTWNINSAIQVSIALIWIDLICELHSIPKGSHQMDERSERIQCIIGVHCTVSVLYTQIKSKSFDRLSTSIYTACFQWIGSAKMCVWCEYLCVCDVHSPKNSYYLHLSIEILLREFTDNYLINFKTIWLSYWTWQLHDRTSTINAYVPASLVNGSFCVCVCSWYDLSVSLIVHEKWMVFLKPNSNCTVRRISMDENMFVLFERFDCLYWVWVDHITFDLGFIDG